MLLNIDHPDKFLKRHIGPSPEETVQMLEAIGEPTISSLIEKTIPDSIRLEHPLNISSGISEEKMLNRFTELASKNKVFKSYIGMGYSNTFLPSVIRRNILENPGWYTQYTPYQSEISQGRLEALLNFQTMICDLTAMPIANASLLDEGTAAAEAMILLFQSTRSKGLSNIFYVSEDLHPQTIDVLLTRAEPFGIEIKYLMEGCLTLPEPTSFGVCLQYPATDGTINDYRELVENCHSKGCYVVVATNLLSLTLLKPPGEWGADIVVGTAQNFGVPLGYGGPHPAFFAVNEEFKRLIPGRIVGISKDVNENKAYRLALQTREQHIRREKATSNICTAQVLLAIISGMYAVYHGPKQLTKISKRIYVMTRLLASILREYDMHVSTKNFFDTIKVELTDNAGIKANEILARCKNEGINLRIYEDYGFGITIDETCSVNDITKIAEILSSVSDQPNKIIDTGTLLRDLTHAIPEELMRTSSFLEHEVFNQYHSETEMLRYIKRLEQRDLSLTSSMIPLGSCTMKLNATTEMLPLTYKEFSAVHPFVPLDQAAGYHEMIEELESFICEITGFKAVSFQPNSGAQGEYAGLLTIRKYFQKNKQSDRKVALIPSSAHGTNPASAILAGMQVVVVKCDAKGNIDLLDLEEKALQHKDELAVLMITYPSTHGVFEEGIMSICDLIHKYGGLVYMDGANMNAQVGLTNPAIIGADVCHLNLHKTFCIPHGGGGPGMGPIAVTEELKSFLPKHAFTSNAAMSTNKNTIASAPWSSASILLISYGYMMMMGGRGLTEASEYAILNANYLKTKLEPHYKVLYSGINGYIAHEFILDFREFKQKAGIEVEDIAKRLMDYGFHAPTVSFPVPGTLMIEPTESESKKELDRFCEALISIRNEIEEIIDGVYDNKNNVLKNAPHTIENIASDQWEYPYTREKAAYPLPYLKVSKFWVPVGRINNSYGDRNLVCTCPSILEYA